MPLIPVLWPGLEILVLGVKVRCLHCMVRWKGLSVLLTTTEEPVRRLLCFRLGAFIPVAAWRVMLVMTTHIEGGFGSTIGGSADTWRWEIGPRAAAVLRSYHTA